MAYPSDLPTVTVRHRIVGTDGTPARGGGRVTAVLTGRLWTGQGSVVPTQYTATVQEDGTYELELPPVDHPDIVAGRGEAYLVTEPAATIDTRRPGRVATEQFHVAPLTEHVGQVVDVSEVVSPRPKPGGGIELVTGPVTDETMAGVIANPNSQTSESLKITIGAEADRLVPGKVADALREDATIRQSAEQAVTDAATGLDIATLADALTAPPPPKAIRPSRVVTTFPPDHGWTIGTNGTVEPSSDHVLGAQSLKMTTNGTGSAVLTPTRGSLPHVA